MEFKHLFENFSAQGLFKSLTVFAGLGDETSNRVLAHLNDYVNSSEEASLSGAYKHLREELERGSLVLTLEQLFKVGIVLSFTHIAYTRNNPAYLEILSNPQVPEHIEGEQAKLHKSNTFYRRYVVPQSPDELSVSWIEPKSEYNALDAESLSKRFKLLERILTIETDSLPKSFGQFMKKRPKDNVVDYVYGQMLVNTKYYQDFVSELIADAEAADGVDTAEILVMFRNYTLYKISNQAYREMFSQVELLLSNAEKVEASFPNNPLELLADIYEKPQVLVSPKSLSQAYWGAYYAQEYAHRSRTRLQADIAQYNHPQVLTSAIYSVWGLLALAHNRKGALIFKDQRIKPFLIETMRLLAQAQLTPDSSQAAQSVIEAVNVFAGFFHDYTADSQNEHIFNKSAYRRIRAYLKRFGEQYLMELQSVVADYAAAADFSDEEDELEDQQQEVEDFAEETIAPTNIRVIAPNLSYKGVRAEQIESPAHREAYIWLNFFHDLEPKLPKYIDPRPTIFNPVVIVKRLAPSVLGFEFKTDLEEGFYALGPSDLQQVDTEDLIRKYALFLEEADAKLESMGCELNRVRIAIRQPDGKLTYKSSNNASLFRGDELWHPRYSIRQQLGSKLAGLKNYRRAARPGESELLEPGFYLPAKRGGHGAIVHPYAPNVLTQINIPVEILDQVVTEAHTGAKIATLVVEPLLHLQPASIFSTLSRTASPAVEPLKYVIDQRYVSPGRMAKVFGSWASMEGIYLLPKSLNTKARDVFTRKIVHQGPELDFEKYLEVHAALNAAISDQASIDAMQYPRTFWN